MELLKELFLLIVAAVIASVGYFLIQFSLNVLAIPILRDPTLKGVVATLLTLGLGIAIYQAGKRLWEN